MRIIYSFRKEGRFWIVNCPSDKSVKESRYNSLIEAINIFFASYESIEYIDVVIPLSIPTPIPLSKRIRVVKLPVIKHIKPMPQVLNDWDKPIPESTVEFRIGMKWVVAIPPYEKQNVYYLNNPLLGTQKFASGKGSSYKTLQVINGTLKRDIYIDLGWTKTHIYPDGEDLELEFIGGREAALERWKQVEIKRNGDNSFINRLKNAFSRFWS